MFAASSRIISSGSTYQDGGAAVSLHCWLVDRALAHDAFSRSAALAAELKSLKYRVPPRQFFAHLGDATFQRRSKPRYDFDISFVKKIISIDFPKRLPGGGIV